MNPHLDRGLLLFDQSRYPQAEAEFRQAIASDPQHAYAHAMLGLCLSQQGRYNEAESEIKQAIHFQPDLSWAHYARACVLHDRNDLVQARQAIDEAIRLDPSDVENYALLSSICFAQGQWNPALQAAELALSIDAEHVRATNLRAMALVKLGRKGEAGAAIETALSKNPEDSTTHANQGWTLIEQGQYARASEHFKESLRLDPQNEWARQGILEAMKARNPVYALMLKYFLWMSKLSSAAQWGIIMVGIFGSRMLRSLAKSEPALAPFIWVVLILYFVFVVLTWIARPMFNLFLRMDRFGRLVLSDEQKLETNLIGASFIVALAFVGLGLLVHESLLFGGLVFGLMAIPLAGVFSCQKGWPRKTMASIAGVLFVLAIGSTALLIGDVFPGSALHSFGKTFGAAIFPGFFLGIVLAQFAANFLAGKNPRK